MWISGKGIKHDLDIPEVKDKLLAGITSEGNKKKYYFVETEIKKQTLRCLSIDETGTRWEQGHVEIPGIVLGIFFTNYLHLICTNPKDKILRVMQIDDLKVKGEKTFIFNESVIKKKRTTFAFWNSGKRISPSEAIASVKILRQDSLLIMSVDDPFDEFDNKQTLYKTTVYKLNLVTGKQSMLFFVEPSEAPFNSIIFDGHLFRIVMGKETHLQVFKLNTATQILSVKPSSFGKDAANYSYFINGEKNTIEKASIGNFHANYVIPDSVASETVLRIGATYPIRHPVGGLGGFGLAGSIIQLAVNTAILTTPAEPEADIHFYLRGSPEKGFEFTNKSGLLSQKVYEYEINKADINKKYQYKTFLLGQNFAYGIYLEKKSDKVEILKF
jgi:hypothetical protein